MKFLINGEQQGPDCPVGSALAGRRCDSIVMSFADINKMAEMLRWNSDAERHHLHAVLENLCTKFIAR